MNRPRRRVRNLVYFIRKCSASNRILSAKDHASIQINIAQVRMPPVTLLLFWLRSRLMAQYSSISLSPSLDFINLSTILYFSLLSLSLSITLGFCLSFSIYVSILLTLFKRLTLRRDAWTAASPPMPSVAQSGKLLWQCLKEFYPAGSEENESGRRWFNALFEGDERPRILYAIPRLNHTCTESSERRTHFSTFIDFF